MSVLKYLFVFAFLFVSNQLLAQTDSIAPVEPGMETSFDNTELLIIALVGLALLMLLYFYFRRRRK